MGHGLLQSERGSEQTMVAVNAAVSAQRRLLDSAGRWPTGHTDRVDPRVLPIARGDGHRLPIDEKGLGHALPFARVAPRGLPTQAVPIISRICARISSRPNGLIRQR